MCHAPRKTSLSHSSKMFHPQQKPGGFSIVEICIAILIASIFGAAAFATNSQLLIGLRSQKETTAATLTLQQRMESFRATAFSNIADRDYVKDNILKVPTGSEAPLGKFTETLTIGVYPPDGSINTVIRRTPSKPNGENVSENHDLARRQIAARGHHRKLDRSQRSHSHPSTLLPLRHWEYRTVKINSLKTAGMTLSEIMITMGCASILLTAVLISGISLQRTAMATEQYSISQADQLRVEDYIAMESRRCVSATVLNNTVTFLVPKYYDNAGAPVNPSYTAGGAIQYGNGTIPISYYQSGTSFVRNVNGTEIVIASDVSSFNVTPIDLTSSLSCSITFAPKFTKLPAPVPIAATTVYINTFLRNAAARQ